MKVQRWGDRAAVAAAKNRGSKWPACVLAAVLLTMLPPDQAFAAEGDVKAPLTLDEIVVTASRVEEKAKEVTANVTVIDEEEIKASSAHTLGEILAEKAVGHIQNYPGALTAVGIRGFRTETHGNDLMGHVLILINGRRAATGNAAKLMIRNNVERIEIIRGPASVQYGSAAMGGVVNIITKRGVDNSAFIEGGLGSWEYDAEAMGLSANTKGVDFYGTYEHRSIDDYDTARGDQYENTGFSRQENVYVNLATSSCRATGSASYTTTTMGKASETPDIWQKTTSTTTRTRITSRWISSTRAAPRAGPSLGWRGISTARTRIHGLTACQAIQTAGMTGSQR